MQGAGVPAKEPPARAGAAGERGLGEKAKAYPQQLSGGQQQRIGDCARDIERAGADTGGRADGESGFRHGEQVMELLRELNRDGITVVMVTHDAELVPLLPRGAYEGRWFV